MSDWESWAQHLSRSGGESFRAYLSRLRVTGAVLHWEVPFDWPVIRGDNGEIVGTLARCSLVQLGFVRGGFNRQIWLHYWE